MHCDLPSPSDRLPGSPQPSQTHIFMFSLVAVDHQSALQLAASSLPSRALLFNASPAPARGTEKEAKPEAWVVAVGAMG